MMEGINSTEYLAAFGVDLHRQHEDDLESFRAAGLVVVDGSSIRLTRSGALVSNEVFTALI
jgi:coproporphyrinogen III oxidase-like Fe-S oxidoreductase